MSNKPVTHLLWCDLEATGLPVKNDYSDVHILEVGFILTDMALNPLEGYQEVIAMTKEAAEAVKRTPAVLQMHKDNGLLRECVDGGFPIERVQSEVLEMLDDHKVGVKQVAMAGSGVAAYDLPLVKEKMPVLADALTYFCYDVGAFRRMLKLVVKRDLINPTSYSYGDLKKHRAMADVEAHLKEATDYKEALVKLIPPF